jgi:HEAT repeat protein
MFPGDRRQPAFVAAVQRIRAAALVALESGPVRASVLASRFVTDEGPLPMDEIVQRLATACYDRRVETLSIRGAPDIHDIASLCDALSLSTPEVSERGGAQAVLSSAGVVSISLGEQAPRPEGEVVETDEDLPETVRRLQQPAKLASEILPRDAAGSPVHRAELVLRSFHELMWSLPPRYAESPEVYGRLREVMQYLPADVSRLLAALLLERSGDDPVAMRVIGTMTDTDLARLLLHLGRSGGPNPQDAARRLTEAGARRNTLLALVETMADEPMPDGAPMVASGVRGLPFGTPTPNAPLAQTLSDLMARRLSDTDAEDLHALRDAFPSGEDHHRAVTLQALHDYLRSEPDVGRIEMVLDAWVERGRDAVKSGLPARAAVLVHAVEGVLDKERANPEVIGMVDRYQRDVLDGETVGAALMGQPAEDHSAARAILELFGPAAVERLFALLTADPDPALRAVATGTLADLAPRHMDLVEQRLDDADPAAARTAVQVLARTPGPETHHLLQRAAAHADGTVRAEVVRVLPGVAGPKAVPALRAASGDPDQAVRRAAVSGLGGLVGGEAATALASCVRESEDQQTRQHALDQLATHPAPEVSHLLAELASRSARPKLRRGLRRRARAILRQRRVG